VLVEGWGCRGGSRYSPCYAGFGGGRGPGATPRGSEPQIEESESMYKWLRMACPSLGGEHGLKRRACV